MKNLLFLLAFLPTLAQGQYMATKSGNGALAYTGDGGPCYGATLPSPRSVVLDGSGNIYITLIGLGTQVRKIDTAGIITTIVGIPVSGFSGDGGPATAAAIRQVRQVAFDNAGNMYLADGGNNRVRKIDEHGIITTFAGNGSAISSGDGGPATNAQINYPSGVIFDLAGNAYITENLGSRIRKVNTAGIISTYAGTSTNGYSGDGGPATDAQLGSVNRLLIINTEVGPDLYLSDGSNNAVRKVSAAGIITTYAGDGTGTAGYSGDGGQATAAGLSDPVTMCCDNSGNFYFADRANNVIRVVSPAGIIHTFAGTGTPGYNGDCLPATQAELFNPYGIAADAAGNIYIADQDNNRLREVANIKCVAAVNTITHPTEAITLYPNPASETLTITAPQPITRLRITNLLGQTLFTSSYPGSQAEINVAGLAPGVYFVVVNGEVLRFVRE